MLHFPLLPGIKLLLISVLFCIMKARWTDSVRGSFKHLAAVTARLIPVTDENHQDSRITGSIHVSIPSHFPQLLKCR